MMPFTQEQLNLFVSTAPREMMEYAKYFITAGVLQQTLIDSYPNGLKIDAVRESGRSLTVCGFRAKMPEKSDPRSRSLTDFPLVGVDVSESGAGGVLNILGRDKLRAGAIQVWGYEAPQPEPERGDARREPMGRGDDYVIAGSGRIVFAAALMELEQMFANTVFLDAGKLPERKQLETGIVYYTNRYGQSDEQPWALGVPVIVTKQLPDDTVGANGQLIDCYCLIAHPDGEKKLEWMHSSQVFTQAELLDRAMAPRFAHSNERGPREEPAPFFEAIVAVMTEKPKDEPSVEI